MRQENQHCPPIFRWGFNLPGAMNNNSDIRKSLVDVDDSVLMVIDIQDHFLNKYDPAVSRPLLEKVVWLLKIARCLDVPVVAMAEDIDNAGNLNSAILDVLPNKAKVHNKNAFGLAGNPEILADVDATGRKTAILVGTETDVCVAQSALGLMECGYRVVVLKDAIATTAGDEQTGLNRMRDAGAAISSVKAITYEWLRSVQNTTELFEKFPQLEAAELPGCLSL
jgi:nicotinamidase-related amidase